MSDVRRLLEEDGHDDFASELLRSAKNDAPSEALRVQILDAAIGGGGGGGSGGGSAAKASRVPWKGIAAAGVGTAIVVGLLLANGKTTPATDPSTTATAPPATVTSETATTTVATTTAAPPPAEPTATSPETTAAAPVVPTASAIVARPARSAPATSASSSAGSLAEEVAMLEAARGTLARGDASGAIGSLDGYAKRFPNGVLGREATVLRIEALQKRGDAAAARDLGHRFLAAHPRDAYAARVRSLLGETEGDAGAP